MKKVLVMRLIASVALASAALAVGVFFVTHRSVPVAEYPSAKVPPEADRPAETADTPVAAAPKDVHETPKVAPVSSGLPFSYSFGVDGRLDEAGDMESSTSPYWWLDSGAYMYLKSGVGSTVHGELPEDSAWRREYAEYDPEDTDDGAHPQNIFRLLSRTKWQDVAQEISYRIDANEFSPSPNRDVSNGLLQFARYRDQDDLYYAGVRVDGNAVIKKKIRGTYYTLAIKPILPGTYDRDAKPNLLPTGRWISLKTVTKNLDAKRVSIKLYVDIGKTGAWKLAAEAIDDGRTYGGAALTEPGYVGLRTDFMDVSFDDFLLTEAE